jgi:hypothetical protein
MLSRRSRQDHPGHLRVRRFRPLGLVMSRIRASGSFSEAELGFSQASILLQGVEQAGGDLVALDRIGLGE